MGKCNKRDRKSGFALLIIVISFLFLLPGGAAGKRTASKSDADRRTDYKWQWTFNTGYRHDDLDWSIQGPTPSFLTLPQRWSNLLSELTWQDLKSLQLEFGLERRFRSNFKLKGELAYGLILDGKNQDSDYWGDNRTFEFSRSNNSADGGDTWDFSVGFGYEFLFASGRFGLVPLFGLSYHGQDLTMTNGVQTVAAYGFENLVSLGPFPGLNSTYNTDWYGPWTGLDFKIRTLKKDKKQLGHEFLLGIEYHFYAEYYARANWNLRSDFAHPLSFEHEADGSGVILKGGYKYFLNVRWSLDFNGKYQKWETDPGTDRVFFSDGTMSETPLNEVNWESYALTFGVTCRW